MIIIHHNDDDREEGFDLFGEDDDDDNGDDVMIDEGDDVITWNLRRPGGRSTNSSSPRCTLLKLVRFCHIAVL